VPPTIQVPIKILVVLFYRGQGRREVREARDDMHACMMPGKPMDIWPGQ
jgi:hypothetical protein